jgi:ADP-ribosylglycohydrolase/protein-tyrosine phosphatase
LALADSIAQAGWDLNDQALRYVSWWREGAYSVNDRCFDIGNTTVAALHRFQQDQDATNSGDRSSRASGNGSIMRLAPVPICYLEHFPDQIRQLATLAAESSLPTHASPQCVSACRYMALVLAGLMHGLDRNEVLAADWGPLEQLRQLEPLHPEVEEVASGSFRDLQPPAIKGSGYVVKSLEAALWAFHDAQDFREAVLRAVNLGDDADTTGAVCGQFAGAFWGETGIPREWLDGLGKPEMIEQALAGLLSPAASTSSRDTKSKVPTTQAPLKPIDSKALPCRPEFLTSNQKNKAENEAVVDRALDLAANSDLAGLRSLNLTTSPKLQAWHGDLVAAVERRVASSASLAPPTKSSYWVVPGKLLAGAYPGPPTADSHRKKVEDLLDAGVRAFVNLMEEDETNHEGKPFNPYQNLVCSMAPDATCERFAIKDLSIPTVDEMEKILDFIDSHLNEERTVYVHCWGGVGRTGTVVGCWMLRNGLATAEDVLGKLKSLRRQDHERGYRESPETGAQRDFIHAWSSVKTNATSSPVVSAGSVEDGFQPSPAAAEALRELLDHYDYMEGFQDGPFGKNQLTATESALFAATYEIRRLLGSVNTDECGDRLVKLYDLLVDGVLRSMVLARGGNDWVE